MDFLLQGAALNSSISRVNRSARLLSYLACSAILTLSGCASYTKKAASPEAISALKGAGVSRTGGGEEFRVLTSEAAIAGGFVAALTGGIAGATVMHALTKTESAKVLERSGITDPSLDVSRDLGTRLQQATATRVSQNLKPVKSEAIQDIDLASQATDRFVLDVRVRNWGATYLTTQWNRYTATFALQARLIDKSKKASVAEGHCKFINLQDPNPFTYEQLLANRAERLQEDLAQYATKCVDEVWDQMFPSLGFSGGAGTRLRTKDPIATIASVTTDDSPMNVSTAPTTTDKVLGNSTIARQYHLYLSKPKPKAFAVSESGASWMAWGESFNPTVKETIPQRALRGCQERSQTPCVLYAVDDKVIFEQGLEGKR